MPVEPLTLLLPPWLVERFDLARVLAQTGRWSWSEGYRLLERFDVSGPERGFVQVVLARRRNLWLFRCNQRCACGDFLAVDMSPPAPGDRAVVAIELKAGEPLALGGARLQLARAPEAVRELVATGVVGAGAALAQVFGDPAAVLAHLGVAS